MQCLHGIYQDPQTAKLVDSAQQQRACELVMHILGHPQHLESQQFVIMTVVDLASDLLPYFAAPQVVPV